MFNAWQLNNKRTEKEGSDFLLPVFVFSILLLLFCDALSLITISLVHTHIHPYIHTYTTGFLFFRCMVEL